jgi:hypothetical protein
MEETKVDVISEICSWTPEVLVNLIGELAWPLIVLVLGWRFKASIGEVISNFLNKNNVTEVSAGATGVSAKFSPVEQKNEMPNIPLNEASSQPGGVDLLSVRKRHSESKSDYTRELEVFARQHLNSFSISDSEKVELLLDEVSITQASFGYLATNKVLFRSQFDLFNAKMFPSKVISVSEIEEHFQLASEKNPNNYEGWDANKYIEFPVESKLIEYKEGGYVLTKFGSSYIEYMRKNINLVESLGNI